jgi:hypothetical protein
MSEPRSETPRLLGVPRRPTRIASAIRVRYRGSSDG